ncbi:hypothetical protein ACEYXF_21830 [Streptomyces asiaticus]|uniref:hypothetical protein n=1 Tax=Streptomyces asiaticus TaxID=114695 RepID=UPI0039BDAB2B
MSERVPALGEEAALAEATKAARDEAPRVPSTAAGNPEPKCVSRDVLETARARALAETGLPQPIAQLMADADQGIRRGGRYTDSGDLTRLSGRQTTSLAATVTQPSLPPPRPDRLAPERKEGMLHHG